MRLNISREEHLTYCTNIHPAETWSEVRKNFENYVLLVKRRLLPRNPFGVGLRLSAVAADELTSKETLQEFKTFLSDHDLYIFTINGFPYGKFHGGLVKEKVYLPDWRDKERLRYTNVLANLLAELLPSHLSLNGSISTVPGAFKPEIRSAAEIDQMAFLFVDAAMHLIELKAKSGKTIALALEPEPCCFLETVEETVSFFQNYLFSASSIQRVARHTGLSRSEAEAALRSHLGVCLDLCHAAVEYEDSRACIEDLRRAEIGIFKMQISAGLQIPSMTREKAKSLHQLEDHVYLHQVIERIGPRTVSYTDLDEAMTAFEDNDEDREWRIHFHVPIFRAELGEFHTTQDFISNVLNMHRIHPISSHLEVETYTWSVIPQAYQSEDVVNDICRELDWVQSQLKP